MLSLAYFVTSTARILASSTIKPLVFSLLVTKKGGFWSYSFLLQVASNFCRLHRASGYAIKPVNDGLTAAMRCVPVIVSVTLPITKANTPLAKAIVVHKIVIRVRMSVPNGCGFAIILFFTPGP